MDEHNISGRPTYAWLKHIHEELRHSTTVLYGAGHETFVENNHGLPEIIYNRPWGEFL